MGKVILILGGARSGKTRYAMQLAREVSGDGEVVYLATAEAKGEEMAERIRQHRQDRPSDWRTVEVPRRVASALEELGAETAAVIVDCITLWITNLLLAEGGEKAAACVERVILSEVETLGRVAREAKAHVLLVSNEVGLGVVPPTRLGRNFRDIAGRTNQVLAHAADEVYVMWAGLPQRIKPRDTARDRPRDISLDRPTGLARDRSA